jgi:stage V sporulation protein K
LTDIFEKYGKSNANPDDPKLTENETKDPFKAYSALVPPIDQSHVASTKKVPFSEQPIGNTKPYPESIQIPEKNLDELLRELDCLVGLPRVKNEIKQLLQFVHIQDLRRQKGISNTRPSLHSVFYGSPGTGKTTVARLYGKMLKAMGLLSKGHVVETDRAGLVGGYIGQTAIKTNERIEEAIGGVLFIDEAYSLSKGQDSHWDYGAESIEILLKRMEDLRENLVVIVAGYPEPMELFLSSNEGLRSRFSTFIHFDDYSPQEMYEIFCRLAKQENYEPSDEAQTLVFTAIDYNYSIRDKFFGNARFIRNLFETIIKNQALRIGTTIENPSPHQLRVVLPDDVPFIMPSEAKLFSSNNKNKKGKIK